MADARCAGTGVLSPLRSDRARASPISSLSGDDHLPGELPYRCVLSISPDGAGEGRAERRAGFGCLGPRRGRRGQDIRGERDFGECRLGWSEATQSKELKQ